MSTSSFPDLGVGVLTSKFRLLLPSSMTPHPTPLPSPTMPASSRSEKLLRDALLKDERERQQLSSPPGITKPLTHRRRHSHIPTSSYSATASSSKEDFARGSFLFRTAMSNPRSLSPSCFLRQENWRRMERLRKLGERCFIVVMWRVLNIDKVKVNTSNNILHIDAPVLVLVLGRVDVAAPLRLLRPLLYI